MRTLDLILAKRDGCSLRADEIAHLVRGAVDGSIPDYQIAAWLMAVYFRGMVPHETASLTRAMIDSGDLIDLHGLERPLVDKHSTGGVGDKISLVLAPIAAACGLAVPMMSGRSLGHTGGTLDKLESIPGYRTDLDPAEFRAVIEKVGYAMIGQSDRVVPADRRLYALRDVTGTVESVPLITASILSKKFAEGAEALVFDVKCGDGAFMRDLESARTLARSLVDTGRGLGRGIVALITDMDQPLGRKVGNFLEVEEAIDCLDGRGPADLMEVTYALAAQMLLVGGVVADLRAAEASARDAVVSGSAREAFFRNVRAQGGDPTALERLRGRNDARHKGVVAAARSGFVTGVAARAVGYAAVRLGAGRSKAGDPVLPRVGVVLHRIAGEAVSVSDPLCTVYGETEEAVGEAVRLLEGAFVIGGEAPITRPMVLERVAEE